MAEEQQGRAGRSAILDYDRRIPEERTERANKETVRANEEITCEGEETEGFFINQTTYHIYTGHGQPR
jgi:hypothetical protein